MYYNNTNKTLQPHNYVETGLDASMQMIDHVLNMIISANFLQHADVKERTLLRSNWSTYVHIDTNEQPIANLLISSSTWFREPY